MATEPYPTNNPGTPDPVENPTALDSGFASASASASVSGTTTKFFTADMLLPPAVRDWLARATALPAESTVMQAWPIFVEGVRLLGECEHNSPVQHPLMAELEELAVHHVVPLAEHDPIIIAREADLLVGELERHYYQLAGDATLDPLDASHRIEPLLSQIEALRPVLSAIAGQAWDPFQDLLVQFENIERELHRRNRAAKRGDQRFADEMAEVKKLRAAAIGQQVDAFSKRAVEWIETDAAAHLPPRSHADYFWQIAERAEGLLTQLFEASAVRPELAERIGEFEKIIERLVSATAGIVGDMPLDMRGVWIADHVTDLQDWASDVLTEAEDWSVAAAAFGFKRTRERILKFLEMCPDRRAKHLKKLRQLQTKLRNEWVEKSVAANIERKFGYRFAWLLENTVLVLIVVVCAFLVVEFTVHLSEDTAFTLMIADTIICGVFLFEFFLKIALSPLRWNYFRRHWFFDLLPSIPFAALIHGVEAAFMAGEVAVEGAENIAAARAARFARLPRLARYVRIARPLIRGLRVFLFALRGMDRLVRKQGTLLNRDIVFFEPPQPKDSRTRIADRVGALHRRLRQRKREVDRMLPAADAAAVLERAIDHSRQQSGIVAGIVRGADLPTPTESQLGEVARTRTVSRRVREIRVEAVIEKLVNADADGIEEALGPDFPRQVAKVARVASIPPLCWLPLFREIARARKEARDPADMAARVARAVGRWLQRINNIILWVSDLNGVVTPAQLVDRVGATIVKSTQRPAYRLISIGGGFVAILFVLEFLPQPWLQQTAGNLQKLVFGPVMIIGAISLGLLLFGRWLQRIASTATDFYSRAAEAQFIGLLRDVKQARAVADHAILDRRVLRPEALAQGLADANSASNTSFDSSFDDTPTAAPKAETKAAGDGEGKADTHADNEAADRRRSISNMLDAPKLFRRALKATFGADRDSIGGSLPERVYLLYRDYLSGAPLHRSDTRTTNQLLGNLSMQEVRNRILKLTPKEQRALDGLDLERAQGALFGPSIWFNFITLSIAQRTAQLVVDYNQHAIPLKEVAARPADEREKFDWWLSRKRNERRRHDPNLTPAQRQAAAEAVSSEPPVPGTIAYSTTVFSALDFMTTDTQRMRDIERRFGREIAELVAHDRRTMIREIFGTIPMHGKPRSLRSINAYDLYWKYLGGGKIFLLPFRLAWLAFKGVIFAGRWFYRTLRELINPTLKEADYEAAQPSYDVAMRKILRMRRPVFLAATDLRARVDVEYLGHLLPGETESGLETATLNDDLNEIGASEVQREPFRKLYAERRQAMAEFSHFLERRGFAGDGLTERLAAIDPSYPKRRREVLRALATAYVTDFSDLRGVVNAAPVLENLVARAVAAKGRIPGSKAASRVAGTVGFAFAEPLRLLFGMGLRQRRKFDRWWQNHVYRVQQAAEVDEALISRKARKFAFKWWLSNVERMQYYVDVAARFPQCDTERAAENIIDHIIGNPSTWTEHLVTLRTIQSLTMLDILSDRRIVRSLGEFTDTDEPAIPVVVPTL